MATTPDHLNGAALAFLAERHLASLTSVRADGTAHVVPVGFTWEPGRHLARVTTNRASVKARLAARGGRVVLCQVDGPRWLSLAGSPVVSADPERVAEAVARYGRRYRIPGANPERVVLEITVDEVRGSASLLS